MSNTASYIGKEPTYGVFISQAETGDGSTVAFSLDATAATPASLLVSVGGVVQQPATAYNLNAAGTTLTFTGAPGASIPIWILFLGQTLTVPTASSAAATMITGESALGEIPAAGDYFLLYDASATALKKVAYSNLETGDIAGVTAGTGITGGGTSGTVTVAIDTAVTADLTTAQTLTTKTLTSPVLTSPVLTTPQINDTSADHQYVFAVSELAADRTVTLPLLAAADEFTFNAHAQTLTNKTLTSPDINTPDIDGGTVDGAIIGGASAAAATVTTFTSTGIDDNAASTALTLDGSQNALISQKIFLGGATASVPVSNGQQNWMQQHEASNRGGTTWFSTHASSGSAESVFAKGRSGTLGNYTIVQDDDALGRFTWCADDGVDMNSVAAQLSVYVDGTPGANDTPGRFEFLTTADGAASPTLRMSLDSTGTLNLLDNVIQRPMMKDYSETKVAMAANAVDLSLGNVQTYTLSGNQTLTFTNPIATGNSSSFTLHVTNGGSATLTWPTSVDWAGASAPSLTASGLDILVFTTIDAGTTWLGFLSGADMS